MTTLTLKLRNKRDANRIFDFAKTSNIEMEVVENAGDFLVKEKKKKTIIALSKEVNKSMTKKLFALHNIDYDSYNR